MTELNAAKKNTLKREVHFQGIGIHSGKKVDLWLKPSTCGQVVFRRANLDNLEVGLDPRKVEARNSTRLVSQGLRVQTIEHLLAVLHMFGIDSLVIETSEEEIPIMDGSASPFVKAISQAGKRPLIEKKRLIRILKTFVVREKDAFFSVHPDKEFRISYSIEYDHPLIRRQELSLALNRKSFAREVAPARTFGFLKDAPSLRSRGLAMGGSLENTVVLDDKGVISGPLRYPDEFVRHKILDLIGDLALLGSPLVGHFKAEKAGHRLHLKGIRFLLDNPRFWADED